LPEGSGEDDEMFISGVGEPANRRLDRLPVSIVERLPLEPFEIVGSEID
jgi:hypothetical protein